MPNDLLPTIAPGKFELWRRLLLLLFFSIGIWFYMYVSLAPLVKVQVVDFAYEQDREIRGYYATEQQKYLVSLPLSEYIEIVTEGNLIELRDPEWDGFVNNIRVAGEGQLPKGWKKRIQEHELERGNVTGFFFRPDEEPVAVFLSQREDVFRPVYLKCFVNGDNDSLYLRLNFISFSHNDFLPGSGFNYIYEPPAYFFRPWRPYSVLFLLAGLLLYYFLPRPRRKPDDLVYSRGSVIAADIAGLIVFMLFFALPFLIIGGSLQALTAFLPVTIVLWAMALMGIWIFFISAWQASFALSIDDNGFVMSCYYGDRRVLMQDIASFQPVEKRYPRWLVFFSFLAAFGSRGAQQAGAAGRAVLAASAVTHGIRINLKDGDHVDIWLTNQMGGKLLRGSDKLTLTLKEAGVTQIHDIVVDRSFSFTSGGKAGRQKWMS